LFAAAAFHDAVFAVTLMIRRRRHASADAVDTRYAAIRMMLIFATAVFFA